jgi:protease I
MKLLVAIAPERYRDEELDEPLSVFARAGIGFDIASITTGTCTGMLGGRAQATLNFEHASAGDYAGIVIIGGAGSPAHLWESRQLISLVQAFHESGRIVAAICLSPAVLARAGVLRGLPATVFKTAESVREMKTGGAVLSDMPVVVSGTVITANGPAAARAFGSAIVDALKR